MVSMENTNNNKKTLINILTKGLLRLHSVRQERCCLGDPSTTLGYFF